MTETTENTAGTALSQVAPGALARLQDGKPWTVADLADILAAPVPAPADKMPIPEPAKTVTIGDKLRKALNALPNVFGSVQPSERRSLDPAEIAKITEEYQEIETVKGQLGKRQEAIKESMRIHQDFQAEAEGAAGTRILSGAAAGHVLAATPGKPFETPVEGFEDAWQQRYVKGSTSQDLGILKELFDSGKITRAEYLSFTSEVRVLDEERIRAAIKKNPARSLEILGAITRRSAPSASLYAPKK